MSVIAAFGMAAAVVGCGDKISGVNTVPVLTGFNQTDLVANIAGLGAPTIDPNLVNPWGIAFGSTGLLWVSNNGSGTATVYDANGVKQPLTVTLPSVSPGAAWAPTGVIFNATTDFVIPGLGTSSFIFASENGWIAAWNTATGTTAHVVSDQSASGASYKGLAIAANAGVNFLYATNFRHNSVDVFDTGFNLVRSFTDSTMAAGYAPFGIANIGGQLYVSFALRLAPDSVDDAPGVGNGFVDVFNPDGTLARRFASNGVLNAPWAIVQAPSVFGSFGGAILVGNFGDGTIDAYNQATGVLIDVLRDGNGVPISINGLWGLSFGPAGGTTTLYFASGPNNEANGLVGTLTPR